VLLRHSALRERELLLGQLIQQVLTLSTSKHGSNVAESVLSLAPPRMLEAVAVEIFGNDVCIYLSIYV